MASIWNEPPEEPNVLRRLLLILIVLPVSAGLVLLAVANRHAVPLVVDPFAGTDAFSLDVPLFLVVFGAAIVGVLLGGVAVWLGQGRWRRTARSASREARQAKAEAEGLRAALAARTAPSGGQESGPARPALADRRDAA